MKLQQLQINAVEEAKEWNAISNSIQNHFTCKHHYHNRLRAKMNNRITNNYGSVQQSRKLHNTLRVPSDMVTRKMKIVN